MINIREATLGDYHTVMELMRHLNPDDLFPADSISRDVLNTIVKSDHLSVLLLEKDKQVVGTCYLNIIPNLTRNSSPYAVIENVVTSPTFRHQGIGKKLLQAAIKHAFDRSCYKVMLLTGRGDAVQTFYERCGMDGSSKHAFVVRKGDG